ncbi:fatty acyl-AMP ligase [Kutzneria albida]|uniref:AMP-dependent synthetase/ligase domain-containing protein n=1 Tax=Kutzneria albida DSM 43870 TaxID=1449976 RepID=W5WAZ9_9PSEU|nr:fatty acyl-AMP ligase [Kutzneria albida]AHH98102.1 hypothetical protein KALB_4740 [Kutzneria albida DSM 43870]
MVTDSHPVRREAAVDTLATMIQRHASRTPTQPACVMLGREGQPVETLTYGDLDRKARGVAAALRRRTTHGDRVLVWQPSGLDFVVSFFGCAYAGLVAVPIPYPESLTGGTRFLSRVQSIVKDASPVLALTTPAAAELRSQYDLGGLELATVDQLTRTPAEEWTASDTAASDLAFLQYTSGSTSAPKGAMIAHENVLENFAAVAGAMRVSTDPAIAARFRTVSWLPLFHDMGLAKLLLPMYLGGTAVLMAPTTFIMRPLVWLEAIDRHRAVMCSAPNFAYDLCVTRTTPEQRERLDLSCWEYALNGAEPVRAESLERFRQAFRPAGFRDTAFMPCYGLAEATVYVSGGRRPEDRRLVTVDSDLLEDKGIVREDPGAQRKLVPCGRVPENLTVRIVDPQTCEPCPPDKVGEIWVAGASIAQGYWGQPEATAAKFHWKVPGVAGSFLRTGDLGFFSEGHLIILGRLDDLIIIDGRNHYPSDVELTVTASHPALASNRCAAFRYEVDGESRLGVVAEVARRFRVVPDGPAESRKSGEVTEAELLQAVRQRVAEEHQLGVAAVTLLKPGGLPTTTSGKVQRRHSRQLFLEGALRTW